MRHRDRALRFVGGNVNGFTGSASAGSLCVGLILTEREVPQYRRRHKCRRRRLQKISTLLFTHVRRFLRRGFDFYAQRDRLVWFELHDQR